MEIINFDSERLHEQYLKEQAYLRAERNLQSIDEGKEMTDALIKHSKKKETENESKI